MNKYHITYSSCQAFYDMGYVYADSKEEAEQDARARATAFNQNEKSMITATAVKN